MSAKDIRIELIKLSEQALDLAEFIDRNGTDVQYEVEFVGGTRPVDTPHTSAGHLAAELQDSAVKLFSSFEFSSQIIKVQEAEERYDEEHSEAMRELDLR